MNRVLSNKRLYSASFSPTGKTNIIGAGFLSGEGALGHAGRASLSAGIIFWGALIFLLGGLYLYQVNKVATQGYEMREVENRIQELENESKKLKIKEVELKSMYNIEKSMDGMNLVNADQVSYLEIDGPMAMR